MKFFLYSVSGEGCQILKKIEFEGNDCAVFIKDKVYKDTFDGLLNHTDNPDSFIDKDTIILFDMSGNGSVADSYKRKGYKVFGASSFADQLEHDRDFGFDCMKEAGISIPDMKKFTDWNEAIEFAGQSPDRLVFKPNGSMPCKLTYVSKNNEELVKYLKFVEKRFGKDIDSFILQQFIEGIVVSSEFFCNGKKFLRPANHTVEIKKSMNDELGPSTGCSGNIVWACEDDNIIQQGVAKIENLCIKNNFIGQIDLNAVIDKNGDLYGLEWTPRFGYSATPTLLTLVERDIGELFYNLANGYNMDLNISSSYAGSVRLTIPPYPIETEKETESLSPNIGIPILNWEDSEEECYFYEIMLDEEEQLVHSGGTGVILEAQGVDQDVTKSLLRPYEILEEINVPDKQYRTDLNNVLPDMVEEVEEYA